MRATQQGDLEGWYGSSRGDGWFLAGALLDTCSGDGCGVGGSTSPFDACAGIGGGEASTSDGDGMSAAEEDVY